jgi:septum formation protein
MVVVSATMHALSPQREERARARSTLILASASPRRAELLADAGQPFEIETSGAEEMPEVGEIPVAFAARVARDKALTVARRRPGRWVLGADTIVLIGSTILGKPRDAAEATTMLERLSGREHQVCTAFSVVDPTGSVFGEDAVVTAVAFRTLELDEIRAYVTSGEPLDKAGAYAIQGGARDFVRSLRGSLSNVIGLPMAEVEAVLRAAGLWREAGRAG